MTTDLEKQFFDTFGIEPKYEAHTCDGWGRTTEVKFFANKEEAERFGILIGDEPKYPYQITDRILLELICILNKSSILVCANSHNLCSSELDTLKEEILRDCIVHTLILKSEPEFVKLNIFKRDIQALFKE